MADKDKYIEEMRKKEYKEEMEVFLDSSYKVHKEILDKKLEEKDIIIDSLINQLQTSKVELINKEGIMQFFSCQSDKALRILKFAHQTGGFDCVQVGKEYYINKEGLQRFIRTYDGKKLNI